MARTIHRLSPAAVKNANPGMHCDGGGLYLQAVTGASGAIRKSWLFRFAENGRERQMGLGSLDTVGLAQAREKAAGCRRLRQEGIDPIDARDSQRASAAAENAKLMTFDQCAAGYIAAHRAGWRNTKHASQWQNTLATYVSPFFGELAVRVIDVGLVIRAWSQSGAPSRRRRAGCAAESRRCLIGLPPGGCGMLRTRRVGRAVSTNCFPAGPRYGQSGTMPLCHTTKSVLSCWNYASGTVLRPGRSNSRS